MNIGDDANRLAAEARARVLIDRRLIGARRSSLPPSNPLLPTPDLLALRDPCHRRLVYNRWLFTVPEIPHRHPSPSRLTTFIHSGTHATKDVVGPPVNGRSTRHF